MATKWHWEWRALRWIDRAPGVVRMTDEFPGMRAALKRLMRKDMVRVSGFRERGLYITDKGRNWYVELQHDVDNWGHV